jgi:hypothetical protein
VSAVDAGAGTDAASASTPSSFTGSDTGAGTETSALVILLSVTDTGAGTDTSSVTVQTLQVTAADAGVGTDLVTGRALFIPDTGAGVDVFTLSARYTTADTGTGTESTAVNLGIPWVDTGGTIKMDESHLPTSITVPPRSSGITVQGGATKIGTPVSTTSLSSDKPHATIG